jgi:2,4-dienoyl-CoA reductase-like NADH-dependent reductase (Old Yellow Enzyme family)
LDASDPQATRVVTDPFAPLSFARGPRLNNRLVLAPMTNYQSGSDGRLSEDEFQWLIYRAAGGFGLVMTCAAHVQRAGQGFPGQLGIFSDDHLPGLARLASALKHHGAVCAVQLEHSGIRSLPRLTGAQPLGPSDDAETSARAMTGGEIEAVIEDFVAAAVRAEAAGFDGVEIHGAHGYLLCSFLSPEFNRRTDRWGGPLENRVRIILEIIDGVRRRTGPQFQLGLRLSPERYGLQFGEQRELAAWMLTNDDLDYVDMSLWDCFAAPLNKAFAARPLLEWFADLPKGSARLGVAGHLRSGAEIRKVLAVGIDFAILGHAGILHHDLPSLLAADPTFCAVDVPVTSAHLRAERVGPPFLEYLRGRTGFVRPGPGDVATS